MELHGSGAQMNRALQLQLKRASKHSPAVPSPLRSTTSTAAVTYSARRSQTAHGAASGWSCAPAGCLLFRVVCLTNCGENARTFEGVARPNYALGPSTSILLGSNQQLPP